MDYKRSKISIVFITFFFLFSFLANILLNREDISLLKTENDMRDAELVQKKAELVFLEIVQLHHVNYDRLNSTNKKLRKHLELLVKKYPEYEKIQQIEQLVKQREQVIEEIKRANSLAVNSLSFLRSFIIKKFAYKKLENSYQRTLKVSSRKFLDLFFTMDNLDIKQVKKYINKIENLPVQKQEYVNFQKLMVGHGNFILQNIITLHNTTKSVRDIDKKIALLYEELDDWIDTTRMKNTKLLLTALIMTTVLFILLIVLVVRSIKFEKKLREKEIQLEKLIEKYIIVSRTNKNGIITEVSDAFCIISGYSRKELIGNSHNIIRHPDTPATVFKNMWQTIKTKRIWKGKIKNRDKNGKVFWVNVVIEPILDKNNEIESFIGIEIDNTDAMNLEKLTKNQESIIKEKTSLAIKARDKALAAVRAKDQFLANMSHEIRTPLNAIIGFLDILLEQETNKKNKEHLLIVKNSSYFLLDIINDILDFSKIESGRIMIEKIDFDPHKEFGMLQKLFQERLKEKRLVLQFTCKELPAVLHGDILRIKQILNNFLSNAIKFTPEEKKIAVKIVYEDLHLHVSVCDEGIGISKEYQEKIFEPFTQEDASVTRKYGGTGLGLTISKELIKVMHGSLELESEIGKGTCFTFSLPVEVGKEITKEEKTKKTIYFKNKKVLLAEDNKANQIFMKVLLKKLHIKCDIASDGLEAVALFENNKYDVILMDENMPNMSGTEAAQKIWEIEKEKNLQHTPIIALTANALNGDRQKFLSAGMDEYLTKPVDKEKLVCVLSKLLKDNDEN